MEVILDSEGVALEAGAMYCCTSMARDAHGEAYERLDALVRYVGVRHGRHTFADADDWREANPDYVSLVRQAAPVIDPQTQGWPSPEQTLDARIGALQRAVRQPAVVMPAAVAQEGYFHSRPD